MQRFFSAIALCALATTATAQLQVVIPAGCDIAPGNTSNAFPWGTTASGWGGLRLMCVYGATNFTSQNINAPILINQLKWRPDNNAPAYTGGTFTTATVQLSTSPTGWAGVTTNYATNHGANVTTVYSGSVTHTPTPGTAAWTVTSWCVDITLTTPFLYDPSQGDLVIDVDYPTGSFQGGSVGQMDVQSTNSNAARIFASSMYPVANGITQNHGVVVEVGYVPPQGYAYSSAYGTGCSQPAITHAGSARPVIGTSISLDTSNLPASALVGVTLFGLVQFNPGIDLTPLGMPGCYQYLSIDASRVWVPVNGAGSTAFPIPSNPAFAGVEIETQGATLAPGANALGALSTNGLKHTLDIN